jgi:acetyltransferase-like isoleucine patch superfamily enzyme
MEGAIVGSECNIGEGVFVESGAVVGDRVTVKNQAAIWDGVQIDDDVFIGPAVMFTNDRYPRSPRMQAVAERYQSPHNWRQTTHVGRGASLGAGAIILPGVCVGEYAVVGAASVVSSDVAPHQLVVGNPARPHGWACICGHRLAVELCCLSCGRRYRRQNEGLVPEGTD